MNLTRYRTPGTLGTLRNEVDDLFDRFFRDWPLSPGLPRGEYWPSLDLAEEGNKLIIKADLPGVKPDDVELSVQDNVLTLAGEKKEEAEEKKENFYHCERRYGAFRRTIQLPSSVNADKVEAQYHDGVLTITLPKDEKAMPKKIPLKK